MAKNLGPEAGRRKKLVKTAGRSVERPLTPSI
jgi:hypothetical protein